MHDYFLVLDKPAQSFPVNCTVPQGSALFVDKTYTKPWALEMIATDNILLINQYYLLFRNCYKVNVLIFFILDTGCIVAL